MDKRYYIQSGTEPAKDIYSEYGIVVSHVSGLNDLPKSKGSWVRDWIDEQGLDYYNPDKVYFEGKSVTVTFNVLKDSKEDILSTIKSFATYIMNAGNMLYFDTYRMTGFRGRYDKSSFKTERYRIVGNHAEFEMNFEAPNGICYGFDNEGNSSMNIVVKRDSADIYFADGNKLLNVSSDTLKNQNDGFAIVCPESFRCIDISKRDNKLFLTRTGILIGLRSQVLVGN